MVKLSVIDEHKDPRLLIECSYQQNHLVKLATFGAARWRKRDKAFGCPLEPAILSRLMNHFDEVVLSDELRDWAERLYNKQLKVLTSVKDTSPLTQKSLVPFQMASVRFLAQARRAILGHEMGTGKTPISCVALDYVGAAKVLIVCPNSVKWSWVSHLNEWSHKRDIHVLESVVSTETDLGATIIAGNQSDREDAIAKLLTVSSECVLVINYAQLRIHAKVLKEFDYDVVIADEAHRVGNRKAQQTTAFQQVARRGAYVWMLTGTPVRNRYTDLYTLLAVCDPARFSSYWNFVNVHMQSVPGYWGGVDIVGLRDPEGFNSMLSTFMYRVTKKEAMPHLPEKLYSDLRLVMDYEQRYFYSKMEEEFMVTIEKQLADGDTIEEIISAPNTAAQLIRLRQICLSPALIGGPPSSAKIDALQEIIEDIEGSFIIYSCFRKFLPFVEQLLGDMGIPYGEIVGGQSSIDRADVEKALNSGSIRCILGTIQSMGEGLNLQTATTAIFCDQDWVPAVNLQAEDRIHRGGITESPTIVRLFHPGTVESDIHSACLKKERIVGETAGQVEVVRAMLLRKGVRK